VKDKAQWKFLVRLSIFLAPLIVVALGFEFFLYRAGENLPIRAVLARQERWRDALFLRGLVDQEQMQYKAQMLRTRKPRIAAVGSSRVMKFRWEMFGEGPDAFVNATGLVTHPDDLAAFTTSFGEVFPDVMILGIDPWFLNDAVKSAKSLSDTLGSEAAYNWKAHLTALRRSGLGGWQKIWRGLKNASPLFIGLDATLKKRGYRWDGSFKSSPNTARADWAFVDREEPPVETRIQKSILNFSAAGHASESSLRSIVRSVRRLESAGVKVILFLPPLSSASEKLMSQKEDQKILWQEYKTKMRSACENLDIPFFDATSLAALGLDDRYMSDGYHAEETFHLHLLRAMLKDSRVASALPKAAEAVDKGLRNPKTNFFYAEF
jgi:hypothetical protein